MGDLPQRRRQGEALAPRDGLHGARSVGGQDVNHGCRLRTAREASVIRIDAVNDFGAVRFRGRSRGGYYPAVLDRNDTTLACLERARNFLTGEINGRAIHQPGSA